jgi:hypothetical protein
MDKLLDAAGGCDRGAWRCPSAKFDGSVKEGNSMRAFVISASLVLAVTQVAPALGEDANHIIPGCRAVTDEQSFKDLAEARECLGIIEGMRVGATLQSHILKGPAPPTTSRAAKWSTL